MQVPKIKVRGVTRPAKSVQLSFRILGVVDAVPVKLGQAVAEEEVLAENFTENVKQQFSNYVAK